MPSRRRSRSYSRSRSRSRSPERRKHKDLPYNAKEISESDYFQKIDEFKIWLKQEKDRYFDELSGEKARSYFRKFVKAWNKGHLTKSLYAGVDPSDAPHTAYKWSFASKSRDDDEDELDRRSRRDNKRHKSSRRHDRDASPSATGTSRGSGKLQGPTLPTSSDLTLLSEQQAHERQAERSYERKRQRKEEDERMEDLVGPRLVGKEAQLEKKRMRRENDKVFRESRDEGGLELDDRSLMGGGDSFKDMVARRDAGKKRYEQKNVEAVAAARERSNAFKEKESATMAMFHQLAKQRFG